MRALIFRPDGLFVKDGDNIEPLKPKAFFEHAMLPLEIEGAPLVWDFFHMLDQMDKKDANVLGRIARMNVFEFMAEMEKEPNEIPMELHAVSVRRVGDDVECVAIGEQHESGNSYSIEFYPVNVIREIPIIVEPGAKSFTALEFFTTVLWFVGWYHSPAERDKEHEALLAKAKERTQAEQAEEKEHTIQ